MPPALAWLNANKPAQSYITSADEQLSESNFLTLPSRSPTLYGYKTFSPIAKRVYVCYVLIFANAEMKTVSNNFSALSSVSNRNVSSQVSI